MAREYELFLSNKSLVAIKASLIITILIGLVVFVGSVLPVFADGTMIWTDKPDYEPGETVLISGEGFIENSPLTVSVTRPDTVVETCDVSSCNPMFLDGALTSDGVGAFEDYQYDLDGIEGDYLIDVSDGNNSAQTTFTDWTPTTYTVESYNDPGYSNQDDDFLQGETVYGEGTATKTRTIRLRFRNPSPSNTVVKTCPSVSGKVTTCSYDLPGDAPIGEWDIEIQVQGCCGWSTAETDHFDVACATGCNSDAECGGGETCINCVCYDCSTILLNDGFEATNWDDNWEDDGHDWDRDSDPKHGGSYSAQASNNDEGTFTCDGLDADDADAIVVDFWFRKHDTGSNDFTLYYYDGGSYDNKAELDDLGSDDQWLHYTDATTDSQYFNSNFRIRFDATLGSGDNAWVDDVLIKKCVVTPECENDDDCGFCEKCVDYECEYQSDSEDLKDQCASEDCASGFCDGAGACDIEPTSTVCRISAGVCDVEEKCDGVNIDCPLDAYKPLSTDCGVCAHCDGLGSCVYDGTQNNDCGFCEKCTGLNTCGHQSPGEDLKGECPAVACDADNCDGSGNCQDDTADDGYLCVDDCTECVAGSCDDRSACDGTECTYVSPQAQCNAPGGDCADPDSNQYVCLTCYSADAYNAGLYFGSGTTADCCDDDAGETLSTETFDTTMDGAASGTQACCEPNSCVYDVSSTECVDSGNYGTWDADNDDDTDYCVAVSPGVWYDCYDNNDCLPGCQETCVSNDCVDTDGPVVSNVDVVPNPSKGIIDITATVTEDCTNIHDAEYYFDMCGTPGSGTKIYPADDQTFNDDKMVEYVLEDDLNVRPILNDGGHIVCIRGQNTDGYWGSCKCKSFELDYEPPFVTNRRINDVLDPDELLVCGIDPTLTAKICDDETPIQYVEYLIDDFEVLYWEGYPMSMVNNYTEENHKIWHCSDVEDIIDLTELSEGTHYVKIRGKDKAENWGKIIDQPAISFIKDTTAPSSYKDIDGPKVECDGDIKSLVGNNDCWYITNQTPIYLYCQDPDPQQTGEFAGGERIFYRQRWKENLGDEWDCWGEWQEYVEGPIYKTEDSIHELEWFCNDSCGNEESHHYEIDIVDTQAPDMKKEIGSPSVLVDPECDPQTEVCDYYITQNTDITFRCEDLQPHPVDDVTMYIDIYWKETEAEDWPLDPIHSFTENSGEWTFNCHKDSMHKFVYYCEDALENKGQTYEEIDYVDTQEPVSEKEVGDPKVECSFDDYGNYGFPKDGCWYITNHTPITLNCTDLGPHPVNNVSIYYRDYFWNECPPDFTRVDDDKITIYKEDSEHILEWYCVDELGNEEDHHYEIDIVDTQPPVTTKHLWEGPEYPEECIGNGDECWITQNTRIQLICTDPKPHPVKGTTKYYRYFRDGELIQDWIEYDGPISFDHDSNHTLEYYCVDALNNTEETHVEIDNVDTAPPNITLTIDPMYTQTGNPVKICADVEDVKLTGDPGVGVDNDTVQAYIQRPDGNTVKTLDLEWDEGEDAYCDYWTPGCKRRCKYWVDVDATDLLGNYRYVDNAGEIIVDNTPPHATVLNPHAGQWYSDGKVFAVYAPAMDYGDWKGWCHWWDCCEAAGIDEVCHFWATDFNFEGVNQSEVKCHDDYFDELKKAGWEVAYLGSVPYEDGVCKGYLQIPEESGLTDTVFLAVAVKDKAGNWYIGLAEDANENWITMNIDNEAPGVITDPGPTDPVTKGDYFTIELTATDNDSGLFNCEAMLEGHHFPGTIYLNGGKCYIPVTVPPNLGDGWHTVDIKVQDNEGNVGEDDISIQVDDTPPAMVVNEPEDGDVCSGVNVNITITDPIAGVDTTTVQYRIKELGLWGICLGGCKDSGWQNLTLTSGDMYDGTYTGYFDTSGWPSGKYGFDARACDTLRDEDEYPIKEDDPHCTILSKVKADL